MVLVSSTGSDLEYEMQEAPALHNRGRIAVQAQLFLEYADRVTRLVDAKDVALRTGGLSLAMAEMGLRQYLLSVSSLQNDNP